MNRKYRLLKPLPDSNIGDIYIWNKSEKAYYKDGNVLGSYWTSEHVENNPEWFEEVTDTERTEVIKIEYLAKDIIGKKHIDIKLSSCIYEDQFPAIKKAIEKVLNPEVVEEKKESEFIIGVDAIRGNFEWKDDAQTQVIFKAEEKGEWIAMYRKDQPWSQKKFEADMKKAAGYFSTVPLLCEECGEIGKHKPTCSTNTPKEENKEQSKDWEVVAFIKDGKLLEQDEHNWKYRNETNAISDIEWLIKNCPIHSVRRLSDNKIFTVGDKTKIGFIKKFELKGGKMYWWNEHTWYYMFQLEFSLPEPQPLFVTEPMKESDIISPPQKLIINGIEYHQSKQ